MVHNRGKKKKQIQQTRSSVNFPPGLFSTKKYLLQNNKKKLENGFQFFIRKINIAADSPPSWKILIDFSSANNLKIVEARDSQYEHTRKGLCSV